MSAPQRLTLIASLALCLPAAGAAGQSSSLYVKGAGSAQTASDGARSTEAPSRGQTATGDREAPHRLNAAIAERSFTAVSVPEPRQFAVNDLVTIIIRESSETDFQASLETEKSSERSGEIAEFPRLTLSDLVDAQIRPNQFQNGTPQLDVSLEREFEGEGDYTRSESMSGRITARVIDVKPNGTLVLEARKFVESDKESFEVVVTGTCRAEDITADNTVLSTELYDLHLSKQHEGNLRESTKKGLITQVFDLLFNF